MEETNNGRGLPRIWPESREDCLRMLEALTAELEEQLDELEVSSENMKAELEATRERLMDSEKMAALGQLTAGIAHEIKNPLNFINNFSELSLELTSELNAEIEKHAGTLGSGEADYLKGIIGDISANLQKINDHGKRADSIIRGMLLHARGKSDERIPTDLNALLAEYVNLAYHGMRASDPTFNIKIESSYDESLEKVSVVPQDLSRVFLNLFNNAFYSTIQKKKELQDAYSPLLTVSTKNMGKIAELRIRDNGMGVPAEIREKIFAPYFTTKPAGAGTGLGLSISLEIIFRQHKGLLELESVEGEYAEFIITLPK